MTPREVAAKALTIWHLGVHPDQVVPDRVVAARLSGADAILAALREAGFAVVPVAEVAAQVAAARREGIEAAAARIDAISVAIMDGTHAPNSMSRCVVTSGDCAAAIRALLPAPDTALARDFAAWTEGESDG